MTVPASWGGGAQASVDPGILTTVALACRDSERLRFSYTAADGQRTDRHVEPHRMVLLGRRWYLVAYDVARHDWRSFRADRLTAPRGTGMPFRPRTLPAADRPLLSSGPASPTSLPRTTWRPSCRPTAVDVRQRIGQWCTVEDIDATHCRVRMTGDSLDLARHGAGHDRRGLPGGLPAGTARPGARLGPPVQPRPGHER